MIDRSTGKTQHNHNVNNTATKILIVVLKQIDTAFSFEMNDK